jgi:hypothetical protein
VHVREIVGFPHGLVNYLQVWRRGALGACLFSPDSLCFNCKVKHPYTEKEIL